MVKLMSQLEDKSLADFDFQVLKSCGKKAIVVKVPATKPKIVTALIGYQFDRQQDSVRLSETPLLAKCGAALPRSSF